MFVVFTATFGLRYAVVVLDHHRRRVIHFDVPRNPTQTCLARQITEAFPWDPAPRYLLRDRDTSYAIGFRDRVRAMSIEEVVTAPRSPWQIRTPSGSLAQFAVSAYLIIFNEARLRLIFRTQPLPIVSSSGLKSRQSQSSTNLMRERYEIVSRDSGER
jgi:putative transposase